MNCNKLNRDIYSFHTGGANVAFADGSVRYLHAGININVLVLLVQKAAVVDPSAHCATRLAAKRAGNELRLEQPH